jgi:hypothetical protein
MKATLPSKIKLTKTEQRLFDQIDFQNATTGFGKVSRELMESLKKRNAIPAIRLSYFYDPDFNPGGRGKSRFDGFNMSNEKVIERPTFLKYLNYFILGPKLPTTTMQAFCQIVNDDIDWGEALLKFVRMEIRKEVRKPEKSKDTDYLPEEFYKLAIECLPYGDLPAKSIRQAAMQVR